MLCIAVAMIDDSNINNSMKFWLAKYFIVVSTFCSFGDKA